MKLRWQRRQPSACHTWIFGILTASRDHTGVVVLKKGYQESTVVWTAEENERRQNVKWLPQNYMYFWAEFAEVSGFYSAWNSSKRQSGTQHSKRWLWFLPMDSITFSSENCMELPGSPHCTSQTPSVAGTGAVFMSTVRMFQVMHSNSFHWWPQDQVNPSYITSSQRWSTGKWRWESIL